jgi:ABC-type nitrate/sulfonate/bicarbonate transport system substrate-binding protein
MVHFRIVATLLAVVCLCVPAIGQERPKIYLGASSKTLGYSPLWVATKKGFFDQQGLDVQLVLLRGVPMTVQALLIRLGGNGSLPYESLLVPMVPKVSNGSKRFERLEQLERFERSLH